MKWTEWPVELMLEEKIAVVTGASKGIGLAVTKALVEEGGYVVAGALTAGSLAELERVTPVAVDVTDPDPRLRSRREDDAAT